MLRRKLRILSIVCLLLVLVVPASAKREAGGPSQAAGEIEIFIFTDYFCPPCNSIEPYLEEALTQLHQLGVKINFVDKPLSSLTPLYSKYYLYGAKAADTFSDTLHVRRVLFDIAKTRSVETESELVRQLKQKNIKLALMDVKPVFDRWAELIQRYAIRSTPTCVVTRPGHTSTHVGSRDIPQAIDLLLKELSQPS